MTKFNTLDELAKAYQKVYNASYNNDPAKSFSVEDVKKVCVTFLPPVAAKAKYGIDVAKTVQIENFGYVQA